MLNTRYAQINLGDFIEQKGEVYVKNLLSSFSCPLNLDVEEFLKSKAIIFSQKGLAKTHLVFWHTEDYSEMELVGYYALAQKSFIISKELPKNLKRHLMQFRLNLPELKENVISAILIGQLGKNFTEGNDTLITGSELLQLAINKIKDIQHDSGGRYAYLECEDIKEIKDFYINNGFTEFGKRQLDKDETNLNGRYLVQYLKKL